MEHLELLPQQRPGRHRRPQRHDVERGAGPRRTHQVDCLLVGQEGQDRGEQRHPGDADGGVQAQRDGAQGQRLPRVEGREHDDTGQRVRREHRHHRQRTAGLAQQHRVDRPRRRAHQDQQVAGVEGQMEQRLRVAAGQDHQHARHGDGDSRGLPRRHLFAQPQGGDHQDDDRAGGVDQRGVGRAGALQSHVDDGAAHALGQRTQQKKALPRGAQGVAVLDQAGQGQRQDHQEGQHPAPEGQPDRRHDGRRGPPDHHVGGEEGRGEQIQAVGGEDGVARLVVHGASGACRWASYGACGPSSITSL